MRLREDQRLGRTEVAFETKTVEEIVDSCERTVGQLRRECTELGLEDSLLDPFRQNSRRNIYSLDDIVALWEPLVAAYRSRSVGAKERTLLVEGFVLFMLMEMTRVLRKVNPMMQIAIMIASLDVSCVHMHAGMVKSPLHMWPRMMRRVF